MEYFKIIFKDSTSFRKIWGLLRERESNRKPEIIKRKSLAGYSLDEQFRPNVNQWSADADSLSRDIRSKAFLR